MRHVPRSLAARGHLKLTAMVSSHIHALKVSARLGAIEDRARLVSMRDAIAQSKIAIDQTLVTITSTREAIAFLDRLSARTLLDSAEKQRQDGKH
jgi:hypothetical protein